MKRFFIPAVIATAFLATLTYQAFAAHFIDGQSDFRSFYAAGYILRTGHASQLYDYGFQLEVQRQIVGGNLTLPFLHPPHEAALFAPFSYLSYRTAYVLLAFVNLALLALSYLLLQPKVSSSAHQWLPLGMFVTFLPVAATILEGQDSILFLALLCLSTVSLDRNDLSAGMVVGLCSFRFQIALPIFVLFFLWRKWRFAAGFAMTGILSFLASLVVVGWEGISRYIHTLAMISLHLGSRREMMMLEVFPERMGNLRGLTYGLFRNAFPSSLFVITALLSVVVIAIAAKSSRQSIAIAITAAVLVSYHSMNHDLVLLLIPIFAALNSAQRTLRICGLLVFATPFIFILALPYEYLTAIPILALLIVFCSQSWRWRPRPRTVEKTNGAAVQTSAEAVLDNREEWRTLPRSNAASVAAPEDEPRM